MVGRRTTVFLAVAVVAAGASGCGAKTGLLTPDVIDNTDAVALRDVPADAPQQVCIDLVPDAGVVTVDLVTQPRLSVADVLFVIDHTGSQQPRIDNIKANLQTTIVPAIAANIADVQFGVVAFRDFPIDPYGDPGDQTFSLLAPIGPSVANVQGAINSLVAAGGGDNPESWVETLYQIATGEGYQPWISPRPACPIPGGVGYPCFRPYAQPIMVLITDAPPHNGPGGSNAYDPMTFISPTECPPTIPRCAAARAPHTYAEMVTAMNAIHGRVIGINPGEPTYWGRPELVQTARDTGAVNAAGDPLIFDISPDGEGLDLRVVTAIQTFTAQVRFNASARVDDIDPAHPARPLVRGIHPVSASPPSQITGLDATTFRGVIPGTRLTFGLDLQASIPQQRTAQRIPARVQFLADGRPNLGHQDIVIVIPGLDGSGCNASGTSDGGGPTVSDAETGGGSGGGSGGMDGGMDAGM